MQLKKTKYPYFDIVGDGGISSEHIGEGRFIPAAIIDIENNAEVADLINIHSSTPPGDAIFQWSKDFSMFKPKNIYLIGLSILSANDQGLRSRTYSAHVCFDIFFYQGLSPTATEFNGIFTTSYN